MSAVAIIWFVGLALGVYDQWRLRQTFPPAGRF
jgi:hypothetical protein